MSEILEQMPLVRNLNICPMCIHTKEIGTLVCWGCYKKHKMRYGNDIVEKKLNDVENKLRVI